MKKLYLFLDELRDNLSDFIINTLIITFAAIFISIAAYSLTSLAAHADNAAASDYEGQVTMTLLGAVIFLTACAAIIINNYLSFEKRKKTYEILTTLGARKKLFIFNSLMTRVLQLILSSALSCALSLAVERILRVEIVSVSSIFIAFGIVALLLAAGIVRYCFFR